jgi:hypothetical protein
MVTFPAVGRLGNFYFECATAIAYSLEHELEFTVPFTTTSDYWSPIYLKHLQNGKYDSSLEKIEIEEKVFEYQELPFEERWRDKNIIINGYRQSYKYFEKYRDEILYLFGHPYEKKNVCSIHARYGDYLEIIGKHIIIDENYLTRAMKIITERTGINRFKVFSDDLQTFKNRLGHLYDFEYSSNTNETDDLIEMSCCDSHVNSSSTFSWWGAWLNQNPDKVIVTPTDWFQKGWCNLNTKDIVPESWIKI